ncbi:hypothetical protein FGLOB1_354 [Fusarium globosum]|uniref:Uncharacterized protein n=1 Tax=Fusarium globosum TaxID=78864 RepID=A0A8H5Z0Y2_9HYPO|nr:hypothetical protein FGLOB1_354 [Fusarium globosum]
MWLNLEQPHGESSSPSRCELNLSFDLISTKITHSCRARLNQHGRDKYSNLYGRGWPGGSGDNLKYLAEPDPKQSSLTFKTRIDDTSSLFEIWVPVHLKLTDKKAPKLSSLILSIPLSTIETFSFKVLATVPQPARGKLSSKALGLDFKLNENITVLVPLHAKEQPAQVKTQSGVVIDCVREIAQIKSFYVYIDHSDSHEAGPNSIRNGINEGRYRSTHTCRASIKEEEKLKERVVTLEQEKIRLEKALDDQKRGPGPSVGMAASEGQTVEEKLEAALKEIQDLRGRIKTTEQEIEALQRQNDNIDFEGYDAKLSEVQEEVKELDEKCSGINDNMVTQENLRDFGEDLRQDIGRRISGDGY